MRERGHNNDPLGGTMAQMPREPEAFGEQVAKILRRHFPDRSIDLAGPLDVILNGKHLGLDNLYRMVQYEPGPGCRDR